MTNKNIVIDFIIVNEKAEILQFNYNLFGIVKNYKELFGITNNY